jgi:hypothetical protein
MICWALFIVFPKVAPKLGKVAIFGDNIEAVQGNLVACWQIFSFSYP